jgi:manganese/zinc/iron transport system substrate-binding protein
MAQERLEIVATTGMIADAAREVGGDLVEVRH